VPTLPREPIDDDLFRDTFVRLFPGADSKDFNRLWDLLRAAAEQGHGSMIVVAEDAADEARRLAQQGTVIVPTLMTRDLLRQVSGIDGTIILDPHGVCYAIGIILDGVAHPKCIPSRGSRYNSGVRYIGDGSKRRLSIVVSDDQTIDVIPILRPRIYRKEIDDVLSAFEAASLENYHQPRNWIDAHRFYLNAEQCARANLALDRIEALPKREGQFVIITERLRPDPLMNDSYFFQRSPSY
jgi:hypothetical protein